MIDMIATIVHLRQSEILYWIVRALNTYLHMLPCFFWSMATLGSMIHSLSREVKGRGRVPEWFHREALWLSGYHREALWLSGYHREALWLSGYHREAL